MTTAVLDPLPKDPWIGLHKSSSTAKVRVFVLYGSGGKAHTYKPWADIVVEEFPEFEYCGIELPGRGSNSGDFVDDIAKFLAVFDSEAVDKGWFNAPFVFVGASAGARIFYDVMHTLSRRGKSPEKFYVVGRTPPIFDDNKWIDEAPKPDDTLAYLDWMTDQLLTSKAESLHELWRIMDEESRGFTAELFVHDLILQRPAVSPISTKWKVVAPEGKLLKKIKPEQPKMENITKEEGSVLCTTGHEFVSKRPKGGGRWVELDASVEGETYWVCAQPPKAGEAAFLEDVTKADASDEDVYWKAPISFQIHYSNADTVTPWIDPSGRAKPMSDWAKLTQKEPEFVMHDGLKHDELLVDVGAFRKICEDLIQVCKLRE